MSPSFREIVQSCRESFNSGITRDVNFIEKQLKCLALLYEENEEKLLQALWNDLHKVKMEAHISELIAIKNEIGIAVKNFKDWLKPESQQKVSLSNVLDNVQIHKDPYGVVLIVGAWNYPLRLVFIPLVGAIAAGNCVIIKPSEVASASACLIAELLPKYLDKDCYKVVTGGVQETTMLLQERFDYIFFTGSSLVGKIVREAANKYLTPTTLELGGKCPVYLDADVDMETAARRILWGKCFNGGQTCIGADYLICSKSVEERFLKVAPKILIEFYGENPRDSPDYCRMISKKHFMRLKQLLRHTEIVIGGDLDESQLYISPTIIRNATADLPVMQEEIFGPILPIINFDTSDAAIEYINSHDKPLAIYVFSNNNTVVNKFLKNTYSGGVTVNDTLMHIATGHLPFGGVGSSGMGAYQGKATFDTFVHRKSALVKDLGMIGEKAAFIRYPPYNEKYLPILRILMQQSYCKYRKYSAHILMFGLGWFLAEAYNYYYDCKNNE